MRPPTLLHERVAMLNASIGRYTRSDEATLFAIVGFGGLGVLRSDQDVATRKQLKPAGDHSYYRSSTPSEACIALAERHPRHSVALKTTMAVPSALQDHFICHCARRLQGAWPSTE
jgi:hypothetical protein